VIVLIGSEQIGPHSGTPIYRLLRTFYADRVLELFLFTFRLSVGSSKVVIIQPGVHDTASSFELYRHSLHLIMIRTVGLTDKRTRVWVRDPIYPINLIVQCIIKCDPSIGKRK